MRSLKISGKQLHPSFIWEGRGGGGGGGSWGESRRLVHNNVLGQKSKMSLLPFLDLIASTILKKDSPEGLKLYSRLHAGKLSCQLLQYHLHPYSMSWQDGLQRTELDWVNGSFCSLCVLALGLALHIFATQFWPVADLGEGPGGLPLILGKKRRIE